MKLYTLRQEQIIKRPIHEVFKFFENPANLARITPKKLSFKILTPEPIVMRAGALIDYTIKPMAFPIRWTTLITQYTPPYQFVDAQLRGPYAFWHHTHSFEEIPEGTRMIDEVKYAIPLGILGQFAHFLFVKRQLKQIFDYRTKVIGEFFEETPKNEGGKAMKVVISGGTGFIGQSIVDALNKKGHSVTVLTRNASKQIPGATTQEWDAKTVGDWKKVLDGADAVINMAGESIAAKRWTKTQKEKIISSRLESTKAIVDAIGEVENKPSVLINASAIGYYGHVDDGDVPETAGKGTGFLAETCIRWEEEAEKVKNLGVRLVLLRIGVVLEKGGGALARMIPPFQMFAGGPLGNGKQWFPWVHRDDIVGLVLFALENQNVKGAVNATAPDGKRMADFCKGLGKAMKRPSWAPVPAFMLRIIAGEMADDMLLGGAKVYPERAQELGYQFKFGNLDPALEDIFSR